MKLALIAVMGFGLIAPACAGRGYVVRMAPPPPPPHAMYRRHAPGSGMVWQDGFWSWRGRWVWVPGHWVRPPRPRAVWVPGYWTEQRHGWIWVQGYWR